MSTSQQNIELLPVEKDASGELSDKIFYECAFCGKREGFYNGSRQMYEKLSGDEFYCAFCLRNGFYTKNNKNVLILSFRSIVGYYYYAYYANPIDASAKMYISEIIDYVKCHEETGLRNPVFFYDPKTMLWFIDFSRVGRDKKKIKFEEITRTVANILVCFNLNFHLPTIKVGRLYKKYEDSLGKFHSSRYRPDGRRYLLPTFQGCIDHITLYKNFDIEDTKNFTLDQMLSIN